MIISWLFNNLPYCKTDDYYWIFSDNLLDTQFFDIVNRCGPWKIPPQKKNLPNLFFYLKNLPKFFYYLKNLSTSFFLIKKKKAITGQHWL